MPYRSTITLRDSDYETLKRLQEALDMTSSQTIALAIRVTDIIRANQVEQEGTTVLRNRGGENIEYLRLTLAQRPLIGEKPT